MANLAKGSASGAESRAQLAYPNRLDDTNAPTTASLVHAGGFMVEVEVRLRHERSVVALGSDAFGRRNGGN